MVRLWAVTSAVAMLALIGGLYAWSVMAGRQAAACGGGGTAIAGGSAIGGPFTLVDETGAEVSSDQVIDGPTLVYFGYTFCPDVCPLDAARNAQAVDLLAERGIDVDPVFITIDPARDTPQVLAEFTGYMHPEMLGLTGTEAQVAAAARAYRVYYSRSEGADPDYYLMNHSVFTYLMTPGGFVDVFRGAPGASAEGVTAEQMADRVACDLDRPV